MNAATVLLLNLISTWYMVGLIWLIQLVHYKLFDRVGRDVFAAYAVEHARLITPIVGIPMLVEIATAGYLVVTPPAGVDKGFLTTGFAMVLLLWAATAFLSVPCHNILAGGFDSVAYQRLVGTNWIRTILWSARGVLMAYLAYRYIDALSS